MATFFIRGKLAIVHLRMWNEAEDIGPSELALTADGGVWSREIPLRISGPLPKLGSSERWVHKEQLTKAKVADWISARLSEGWLRVGDEPDAA